jgi:hypothetical protein
MINLGCNNTRYNKVKNPFSDKIMTLKKRKTMSITAKSFLLAGVLFSVSVNVIAQKYWKEITSVEDLCASYPETMKNMFDDFNLNYQGLEKVKTAFNSGNIVDACHYLLAYYKDGNTVWPF